MSERRMSTRSLTSVKKRNKLKRTSSECSDALKFEVELIEDDSVLLPPQKNKSTKTPKAHKVLASSSDENQNKVTDRAQTEKKPSKKIKRVKKIRNTENLIALFNDEDNSFTKVAEKVTIIAETRKVKKNGFPTFIPSNEGLYNDDDTDDRENAKVVVKTAKAKKAKKNKKKSKNLISVDNVSSTTPEAGLETCKFLLQRQGSLIVLLNDFLQNKLPVSSSQSKPMENEDSQSPKTSEKEKSFEIASNDPETFLSEKIDNNQFKDTPGRGTYVKTPAKSLINSPAMQVFDAFNSEDENGIQEDPETYLSLNLEDHQFKDTPGRETYVKTPGKNLISSPTPLNNTLKTLTDAEEENLTQDEPMNNNLCDSNTKIKKGATKASPITGIKKATKLTTSKINQKANKKHSYGSLTSNRNNSSEANNDENQRVFNDLNITTRRASRREILKSDSTSTGSENDFVTVRKPKAGISFDANSFNNNIDEQSEEESSTLIEATNNTDNTTVIADNNESIIELSSDSEPSTILNNTGLTIKSNESISDKKLIRMDTFTKDEEDILFANNQRRKSTRRKWSDVMRTSICGSVPPSVTENSINCSHMAKNKSVTFSLVLPDISSAENKENVEEKSSKNSLVKTDTSSLLTPRPAKHVPISFRKTPKPGSSKWPDSFVSGNCAASSTPLYMSKNDSSLMKSFNENSKTVKASPKQRLKIKMPNFKKIHEKLADKMENLQEMQERKAKRARYLLSNSKSVAKNTPTPNKTVVEKESKRKLIYTPGKLGHSHLINNKTDILSNNSPNSRTLINLPKPLQERIIKRSSIEKIKRLHSKIPTKAGSKEDIIELPNANRKILAKPLKGMLEKKVSLEKQKLKPKSVTKFGFKVDENVKVSKEDQIKAFTTKTKLISNNRERNRSKTVEVRTNRRFELLMQMRAKNMNKKLF